MAISCLIAGTALSAPPAGKSVETETIIVPPDEAGEGDPGLTAPGLTEPDLTEPDLTEPGGETPDAGTGAVDPDVGIESTEDAGPPPTIEYDVSKLPAPVRRLREQIIDAALTGDIDKLRPIFEANEEPPTLSLTEINDPIGFVHVDVGTPDEMYVWPYFARYPLDSLTGPQMVELFKLLTAGDYEDMKVYGTYLFYRVGIAPNGAWKFFVAGD
jgi:hypothetical protein